MTHASRVEDGGPATDAADKCTAVPIQADPAFPVSIAISVWLYVISSNSAPGMASVAREVFEDWQCPH